MMSDLVDFVILGYIVRTFSLCILNMGLMAYCTNTKLGECLLPAK